MDLPVQTNLRFAASRALMQISAWLICTSLIHASLIHASLNRASLAPDNAITLISTGAETRIFHASSLHMEHVSQGTQCLCRVTYCP
jgi:hypothetical protein